MLAENVTYYVKIKVIPSEVYDITGHVTQNENL